MAYRFFLLFLLLPFFLFGQTAKKKSQNASKLQNVSKSKSVPSSKGSQGLTVERKVKKQKNNDASLLRVKAKQKHKQTEYQGMTIQGPERETWWQRQQKGIRYLFCPSCRVLDAKTDCPPAVTKKEHEGSGVEGIERKAKASISRSTYTIQFDVIELEDIRLDIPAFKQFRNNMTDFTLDGESEFQNIIQKIGLYLGTNYEGEGVVLNIIGSASQIPTSFDPSLPNNNIHTDGSSIPGKTSIANNQKLAHARALELSKKIKAVFKNIQIHIPEEKDILMGQTPWTAENHKALSAAVRRKDKKAIQDIYAPFQKDQFVKVISNEKASKTIKPNAIHMYMLSTNPLLKNEEDKEINGVFIISKKTYDQIGESKVYDRVEDRDSFLQSLGLSLRSLQKEKGLRWYFLQGSEEIEAFESEPYSVKIKKMYHLDLVDQFDEKMIEEWVVESYR